MDASENSLLKVLIAEDSPDDALLLERELVLGGYQPQMLRVDCAADMQTALDSAEWDLIIADHNMPGFSSQDALTLAQESAPNVPFILVSGSIGEEIAVDAMKSGAHDYVMKGNLNRLLPAVRRELREANTRKAHQEAQAAIRHMAFHDSLTELVNRAQFEQRLKEVAQSADGSAEAHALLYLDLDQFKLVNDSCGHLAGDELLRRLARRLQRLVRDSDTLARLGGDEFGVLLKHCGLATAKQIAEGLLDNIKRYCFVWDDRSFRVGASIGLVRVDGGQSAQDLLSMADMACYAAKDLGRNRVHVYMEGDVELSRRRTEMAWVQRLQSSAEENSLLLYRQYIQGLQDGIRHSELLLRMRDEEGRIIQPERFIPAAERYSLMSEIDRWVIRHACKLVSANAGSIDGGITFINLSGNSLSHDGLVDYIQAQLREHDVHPGRMGFEITETSAIADFDIALQLIKQLRELGCRVSLDDFGTGMSSFSYLRSLSVDFIKIDGEFVRNMLNDEMDNAIVEAVNHIGHIANIQTVAEHVESKAQLERLIDLGVDFAQGYAVHMPEPFLAPG